MQTAPIATERLTVRRLVGDDAATFHRLATDSHIRRYLLDGVIVEPPWAEDEIARSDELFARLGIGIGLVTERSAPEVPIGFAGFRVFQEIEPEPQLLYALLEPVTGQGYATEVARALIRDAQGRAGLTDIYTAVDSPNRASIRVLEKLGFEHRGTVPGAFGTTDLFVLPASSPVTRALHFMT